MRAEWVSCVVVAIASCARADATPHAGPAAVVEPAPLVVRRGAIEQRMLLTGQVEAAVSIPLDVPRTDDWNLTIRSLPQDGAVVRAGDPVVELDNAAVVERIRETELNVIEAASALAEQQAKSAVDVADKQFEVEKQKAAVDKGRLDTAIPAHLLSRREAHNFALVLSRAEVALTTAKADLRSVTEGGALEEKVKRLAMDKAERALQAAAAQLGDLALAAPRDGIVIIADHPWEGRKFQVGDQVFPGLTVARIPDLSQMVVETRLFDVDQGRVHPGMVVTCIVDAFPDTPLRGHVTAVNPVAQEAAQKSTRRFFAVRVELDETRAEVLRPGLSVRIEAIVRREDDVLLVPRQALAVGEDGSARARRADGVEVEVGVDFCDASQCAVVAELAEGDALQVMEAG
jgi:multidrug resistance efflux pump